MDRENSEVDLLIIGAGPAGLMAAMWAVSCGIKVRIIDKRTARLASGHGDGLHARTLEVMDTFGLASKITDEACPLTSMTWWVPDEDGKIVELRSDNSIWMTDSPFVTYGLTQARLADFMGDHIAQRSNVRVERNKIVEDLTIDTSAEYPVTASIRQASSKSHENGVNGAMNDLRVDDDAEILRNAQLDNHTVETIRAKYALACDGAHSWTRRHLNIPMEGDDIDVIWGVIDIVPLTDFPNPRVVNMFVGSDTGLLWIPRERGMIRLYCVLGDAQSDEQGKMIRSSVTPESIMEAVRKNLHPYKMDYASIEWWAAYQIGQRVARENIDPSGRVCLAGDAVHTHSPQAGQGLNVSMADSHNLVWKLNLVLKGLAKPSILDTYRDERLHEARKLINFDRTYAAAASGREPPPQLDGSILTKAEVLDRSPRTLRLLAHGLQVSYAQSVLIAQKPADGLIESITNGVLPRGIYTGLRMPSFRVRSHSDTSCQHLGHAFTSDGRFRFVVFAGDISQPAKMAACNELGDRIAALMKTYAHPHHRVFDTILVHTAKSLTPSLIGFHPVYVPMDPETQGRDFYKVFYDENDIISNEGVHLGSAYKQYVVDPEIGRVVLMRPDGYVAWQGELPAFDDVERFVGGFLIRQSEL